jgi:type II secretory pathway pseudopilin PulG
MPNPSLQRGFTYVGLLILLSIIALASGTTLTLGSFLQQRANEAELLFIGAQYAAAVRTFVESTPAGPKQFPVKMEDLLRDPRYPNVKRYLRKIYIDPLTGQQTWGLVTARGGGFIVIHSLSEVAPINTTGFDPEFLNLTNKKKYSEWVFGIATPETMSADLKSSSAPGGDKSMGTAFTLPRSLTTFP